MKKKFGFTLAEVLITLSIIGVVAAMTTPSLVGGYQKAKVGPSIRKFMSTLENANEFLVADKETNTISGAIADADEYLTELEKYIEGRADGTMDAGTPTPKDFVGQDLTGASDFKVFTLKGGDAFAVYIQSPDTENAQGSYKGKVAEIYYDINGFDTKPNKIGKDIFNLVMDNSGTVIPHGGNAEAKAYSNATADAWKDSCDETTVTNGLTCAGSIADNNWKVIYRY